MSEQTAATPIAGDHAALVRRYVGSLYALAEQDKAIDAVASDLRGLQQLWDESAEWRMVASDPRLKGDDVCKAAEGVIKATGVGKLAANFVSVVAQNRRLNILPDFINGFLAEIASRRGEYRADVRTARALTPAQAEALRASLDKVTGGKVHLSVVEDASLLGGLTVKLGSQFIDASVKTKLDRLERVLKGAA